jgi:NTP pyrophosphatase (non-canonical NTP hydrolase)
LLNIAYVSLGLGEVGELQGKVKKIIRDSGGVVTIETRKAISKELGDVLWYVSECCNNFGISMDDVAKENLSKLKSRKERGVLEGSGDDR